MGVSVDTGGGGRGRSGNFDLNLVPFIDLLSVCITFLLATAVWTQIMSLQVDQAIAPPQNTPPPPPPDVPPTPPITLHIRADGIWAGRQATGACLSGVVSPSPAAPTPPPAPPPGTAAPAEVYWGCNWPMVEGAYEWDKIKVDLGLDRGKYPSELQMVIVTDDGVVYEHMIKALDLTRELGYEKTLLGGGPPATGTALPGGK